MTLLLIDLDNTLIDRDAAFRRGTGIFLDAHGLPASDVDWVMELDDSGYTDRPTVASTVAARYGLDPEGVLAFLRKGAREHAVITPETRAALQAARAAGHRVVIVTNGLVDQQTGKIRNAGLDVLVDGWTVSEGVGAKKPAPAIFHAAAASIGASLDGAWVIGDRDDADIAGAHALGLSSVWIHLGRDWTLPGLAPTRTAATVAEAIGYAANL
ncbi:hypothetical protein Afil01_36930 [Actinorhabdospora filicis]|uniref:Hydrolase of the HAD superfamily n=1 Tax=Actinorhabdospora filicis TaxID=1785913 RepID=A0A9W6SN10_9ACTN|nr:HAD family hydrolase [Actinorhabdospora filicis]GLZ78886.1 hypothetical protein Afil01_36930 [Actinorhabdospora filicis]